MIEVVLAGIGLVLILLIPAIFFSRLESIKRTSAKRLYNNTGGVVNENELPWFRFIRFIRNLLLI